jgi:hypothetical protein
MPQMATISECRYRWLRVPATKTDAVIAAQKIKGRPFRAAFSLSEMSTEARFR